MRPNESLNGANESPKPEEISESFGIDDKITAQRLKGVGQDPPSAGPPNTDTRRDDDPHPSEAPSLHSVPRHPEDPKGALVNAAREVCDPETIRENAVHFGKAMQSVEPEDFDAIVKEQYERVRRVRSGAIIIPAQREGAEHLKTIETTEQAVRETVAGGLADDVKASRLEEKALPRAEQRVADADTDVETKKQNLDTVRDRVDENRPAVSGDDEVPGTVLQRVPFSALGMTIAGLLGIVVTAFLLEPAISDLIVTSIPFGTFLIAAGVSTSVLFASGAAGVAMAAIRLPERAVGAMFVTLFVVILVKLVTGLDALREGKESGVEALTAATLCEAFLAFMTAYAYTTHQDFAKQRIGIEKAGTLLDDSLSDRTIAEAELAEAKAEKAAARADRTALLEEIERLRDSASRTDVFALQREQQGTAAKVDFSRVEAIADSGVKQEMAAEKWAVAAATASYEKTRAEEYPEGKDIRETDALRVPEPVAVATNDTLTGVQKAAIACLGVGVIGGLVIAPIALQLGAGTAAVLLLLGAKRTSRNPGNTNAPIPPVIDTSPSIAPPASDENPLYRFLPDRMVGKYGNGGAGTGQRQ